MHDARIKYRHLVCFTETARLKSVVKAAQVLGITQPAVSKAIKELEAALDMELFDRSRRNLFLTGFGEVFLKYAAASIAALRQGVDSVAQFKKGSAMTVKVGALPTVSARILPDAVRSFSEQARDSRVHVITGPNAMLITQLRLGEVDFVIGRMASPEAMSGLSFEHLYSERIVFVVRNGHPLLTTEPLNIAALADYQVLMPSPEAVIRPTVDTFLVSNGLGAMPDQVETVSTSFGRSYIRSTDAIWIISEGAVAEDVAEGNVSILPLDTSETLGPVGLTTRTENVLAMPAQLLIQSIRAAGRAVRRPSEAVALTLSAVASS